MKYYIYENNQLKIVDQSTYIKWMTDESHNYLFRDYTIIIEETLHSIETLYAGVIDDDEELLPFVLCRIEAVLTLYPDGVGFMKTLDEVEYFDSLEDFRKRYTALVNLIKSNFV